MPALTNPRAAAGESGREAVVRFGGAPASRSELLAAPLRCLHRPGRLGLSLKSMRGVGTKLAAAAARIELHALGDLIDNVPHSYGDVAEVTEIAELRIGERATVLVEVRSARTRPTRRRNLRIVEAVVADVSGPLSVTWFNQGWLAERLRPGARLLLTGRLDKKGFRPDAQEFIDAASGDEREGGRDPVRDAPGPPAGLHTTGIVPVHPCGEGLRVPRLREWTWHALAHVTDVVEPLPAALRRRYGFAGAADARVAIHFPRGDEQVEPARHRLAYEELFLHQAALLSRRGERRNELAATPLAAPGEVVERWLETLPFTPTGDQRNAFAELDADLESDRPMQRLLMGEVGSGKTVVALYAMLRALECGGQAALMAPTETLAEQHYATLERLLAGSGIPTALLRGSTTLAQRRRTLGVLATGELGLIVGTHALIEPGVEFARLGVAVIDEQHRFGVSQRRALDAKGAPGLAPHVLHMTATPIPRTLSLTAYGDLDATTLRELPAGRRPIKTWHVGEDRRQGAYGFLRDRLREGRQAYVVCPLVNESDADQAKAVTIEAERLASAELQGFTVEVLHGQMPSAAKSAAMARFASGEAQVLVATSVIEVGIDVANATVMLIEDADRYGLSQLHQLRGRVGRGEHDSQCILFADPGSERARLRLEAIARERDGFELAEVDLALRGEGEVLGTRQSGLPRFRVASLPEDAALLVAARADLIELLAEHGSLEAPALGPLIDAVRSRFGDERAEPIAA
ncbi:MAG: ATP-dependent DNA helicase RecG [Solirubrobacterales bacterium]|nr:ATP-dependent DNA helicase RecG [Solirubrobacterales bacterium]